MGFFSFFFESVEVKLEKLLFLVPFSEASTILEAAEYTISLTMMGLSRLYPGFSNEKVRLVMMFTG